MKTYFLMPGGHFACCFAVLENDYYLLLKHCLAADTLGLMLDQ